MTLDSIMAYSRRLGHLLAAALFATVAGMAASQPVAPAPTKTPSDKRDKPEKASPAPTGTPAVPSGDKKNPPTSPLSLEALKLPAGAILVICDEAKEALRLIPKAIVLTPEEYQRLLDKIDQLQRQANAEAVQAPSTCKLTGDVEGDLAHLHALFEFKTDRDRTFVNVGCQRGWPTDARLDGQLPWLQARDDGLVIQADKAGLHQATVDLLVPLGKGAERSLDLDLPRAAITQLERLDLPASVVEVRLGDRSLRPKHLDALHGRIEGVSLGPIDHLELTWKGPATAAATGPLVLAAAGHIVVRVSEAQVFTDAELTLKVLRGETDHWQIQIPLSAEASAEVKLHPQDEPRLKSIDRPQDKQSSLWTIRLKEPSAKPLRLTLQIRQPKLVTPVPVGPFAVLGALTQNGDVEVHAPDDLRVRYEVQGDVSQRDVSAEQRRDDLRAAFAYWNVQAPSNPTQLAPALLSLQVETAKGAVETRVTHHLRLIESDSKSRSQWQLTTRMDITPIRAALDRLDVSLPPGYTYERQADADPAGVVEDIVPDRANHVAQIKLAQKQRRRFSVTLLGSYAQPPTALEASLELPRPLLWSVERGARSAAASDPGARARSALPVSDRGGQVNVLLPEGLELLTGQFGEKRVAMVQKALPSFLSPLVPRPGTRAYTWQTDAAPQRLELAWRPYRPELAVDAVIDLETPTADVHGGRQARVQHQLRFRFPQTAPAQVLLYVPVSLQGRVQILEGGTVNAEEAKIQSTWTVALTAPVGKEHKLTLAYSFPLPNQDSGLATQDSQRGTRGPKSEARGPRIAVPLVQPVQATRGETKIRIWCDPQDQAAVVAGQWEEQPTEIVADRRSLPDLVLRGELRTPLTLSLSPSQSARLASAVLDRVLIRAIVTEDGYQNYRARFLLSKVRARHLDIDLPTALSRSNLRKVLLDGKEVTPRFIDDTGQAVDAGKRVRLLVEPELYRKPVVLEVNCQVDSGRVGGNGLVQCSLRPPLLLDAVLLGRMRWQVELPAQWMPLCPQSGYVVDQRCDWSRWLLAPRPGLTNENLEQWFAGAANSSPAEESEPSLVCWQTTPGSIEFFQVPQRLWLLVCSSIFLTLGLGLLLARLPRAVFWSMVVGVGLVAVLLSGRWPGVVPAIVYGCEPGALVLLLVVGIQWVLQRRYRRQVVFMPGFSRLKPGSSLVRAGSSNRPRDPSTVDEPSKRASAASAESRPQSNGQ